jgi:hypothetical protein
MNAQATEAGYGKAGKQKPLSNFPTATTTTKYIQLWDTDSRGKANHVGCRVEETLSIMELDEEFFE